MTLVGHRGACNHGDAETGGDHHIPARRCPVKHRARRVAAELQHQLAPISIDMA